MVRAYRINAPTDRPPVSFIGDEGIRLRAKRSERGGISVNDDVDRNWKNIAAAPWKKSTNKERTVLVKSNGSLDFHQRGTKSSKQSPLTNSSNAQSNQPNFKRKPKKKPLHKRDSNVRCTSDVTSEDKQ